MMQNALSEFSPLSLAHGNATIGIMTRNYGENSTDKQLEE